ncbi:MAG: hypothetical protein WC438_00665 [Candidatus Pacearchaeota archaeon]
MKRGYVLVFVILFLIIINLNFVCAEGSLIKYNYVPLSGRDLLIKGGTQDYIANYNLIANELKILKENGELVYYEKCDPLGNILSEYSFGNNPTDLCCIPGKRRDKDTGYVYDPETGKMNLGEMHLSSTTEFLIGVFGKGIWIKSAKIESDITDISVIFNSPNKLDNYRGYAQYTANTHTWLKKDAWSSQVESILSSKTGFDNSKFYPPKDTDLDEIDLWITRAIKGDILSYKVKYRYILKKTFGKDIEQEKEYEESKKISQTESITELETVYNKITGIHEKLTNTKSITKGKMEITLRSLIDKYEVINQKLIESIKNNFLQTNKPVKE